MVRQAHHERNQLVTVRPEPVEGLNQTFPKFFYGDFKTAVHQIQPLHNTYYSSFIFQFYYFFFYCLNWPQKRK